MTVPACLAQEHRHGYFLSRRLWSRDGGRNQSSHRICNRYPPTNRLEVGKLLMAEAFFLDVGFLWILYTSGVGFADYMIVRPAFRRLGTTSQT